MSLVFEKPARVQTRSHELLHSESFRLDALGPVSSVIDAKRGSRKVVLTVIAAFAVLVLDTVTPPGLAVWLLQVVLIWIATLWADREQLLAIAAISATFIVLGFWWSPRTGPVMWVDQCNVFISLGTVSALTLTCLRQRATEDAHRKAKQEFAEAQETVHILHGLLPICAWCKKIRNEAGSWEHCENYIHDHSHVEFTHGICQECAARVHTGTQRRP
jgi:hypothetical protein